MPNQMNALPRLSRRMPVILFSQDVNSLPQHSASSKIANLVLEHRYARRVSTVKGDVLHLTVNMTWRQVKDRLPKGMAVHTAIPIPEYTGVGNLDLSYPAKGMETVRHPHEAMRQACRQVREGAQVFEQLVKQELTKAMESL